MCAAGMIRLAGSILLVENTRISFMNYWWFQIQMKTTLLKKLLLFQTKVQFINALISVPDKRFMELLIMSVLARTYNHV